MDDKINFRRRVGNPLKVRTERKTTRTNIISALITIFMIQGTKKGVVLKVPKTYVFH